MRSLSIQQKLFILTGIALIVLMLFFLSKELYKSFQLDQQITSFKNQNEEIKGDIHLLQGQVAYFESEQYKDKYAKEILNKLKPGEKVLVILDGEDNNLLVPRSEILEGTVVYKTPSEAWHEYFFGKENLEMREIK